MGVALAKLLPWVIGVGGLLFAAGAAEAKAPGRTPPPELMSKIKAAYDSADPTQLRAVALECEQQGFTEQAADLRKMADTIDSAVKRGVPAPPAPPPGVAPSGAVITSPGLPALTPQVFAPGTPAPDARVLAGAVALHLRTTSKGREDKILIARFQRENLVAYGGKVDGLYGPKTALVLARTYGIVPPKPFYWPRTNMLAAKANYRAALLEIAARDLPRAEEWRAAAQV